MLSKRLFLCVVVLASVAAYAAAPVYKIRSLKFTGSRHYTQEHLVAATGLKIGEDFDKAALNQIAERLSASGAFADIQYKFGPSGDGMGVQFQLVDAESFLPVIFDNFVWWTNEEVAARIQQKQPLFDGSVPEGSAMVEEVRVLLEDLLRERGVASSVSYQSKASPDPDLAQSLVYVADTVQIPIARIELTGATHLPEQATTATIKALIGSDYHVSTVQPDIYARLDPAYRQLGYLKMHVQSPSPRLEGDKVAVTVPVSEGAQYKIKSVRWSGDTALVGEDALATPGLQAGAVADAAQLEKAVKQVRERLGSKGYMRAEVEPETDFDDGAATVAYDLRITAGQQFQMGNFEVLGLDDVSSEELQQLWGLKPGAPFDSSYIQKFISIAFPQLKTIEGHKLSTAITTRDPNIVDVTMNFEDIPRVQERRTEPDPRREPDRHKKR